jgi:hypothetical protein
LNSPRLPAELELTLLLLELPEELGLTLLLLGLPAYQLVVASEMAGAADAARRASRLPAAAAAGEGSVLGLCVEGELYQRPHGPNRT